MNYKTTDTLLSLKDVSLKYSNNTVLRDINLEIKDIVTENVTTGQIVTLLGKSGSGKSTLFKVIAGLLRPTTGEVLVGMDQKPVQPGLVGMVLQNYPLFEHRTFISNLRLVCKDKEKIDTYLNEFDMYDHKDKYPKQLSGGQRQRAAIIQQLLSSEHFILLDEPYSGLDPVAVERLSANITKVVNLDERNTVIISSHILEPAMAISDSIWILGRERDKEGSTVLYNDDLAAQGLAWNPEIRKDKRFIDKVDQIRQIFQTI